MKNMQKGFTLIELMIVVAIIAILAAIAIPAYQNYLVRAQVSEGSSLMDSAKTAVAEYYSNHGNFPLNNLSAGIAPVSSITGTYVSGITVTSGQISAAFAGTKSNAAIKSSVLVFSPTPTGGSVTWTCNPSGTTNAVDGKYLPSSCRN